MARAQVARGALAQLNPLVVDAARFPFGKLWMLTHAWTHAHFVQKLSSFYSLVPGAFSEHVL